MYLPILLSFVTSLLATTYLPVAGASVKRNTNSTFFLESVTGTYAGRYVGTMMVSRGGAVLVVSDATQKQPVYIDAQSQLLIPDPRTASHAYAPAYYMGNSNTVVYLGGDSWSGGLPASGFKLSSNGSLIVNQAFGNLNGILACGLPSDADVQLFYSTEDTFPSDCELLSLRAVAS